MEREDILDNTLQDWDKDLEKVFRERDGMKAINYEYSPERLQKLNESRLRSLEKRELERRKRQQERDKTIRLIAGIVAAANIVLVGTVHLTKVGGLKKPKDTGNQIIENDGPYNGQGKAIFSNGKNWTTVNGKDELLTYEVAKDLSSLSEINRKFALFEITDELQIGSIWVDENILAKNKQTVDNIVKDLSALVGKTDTNYLNVDDLNDVVVRYGYTNYQDFAKDCQSKIELYQSIIESETTSKGVNQ